MLHCVQHVDANFVDDKSSEAEPNSKVLGCVSKTMRWKKLPPKYESSNGWKVSLTHLTLFTFTHTCRFNINVCVNEI